MIILFVVLTPGIILKAPGSKLQAAAIHAVLFGLVMYFVQMLPLEGFQTATAAVPVASGDPILPITNVTNPAVTPINGVYTIAAGSTFTIGGDPTLKLATATWRPSWATANIPECFNKAGCRITLPSTPGLVTIIKMQRVGKGSRIYSTSINIV